MLSGDQYQIVDLIGRGGFGSVYRAQYHGEEGFTRQVALKVLNPDLQDVERLAKRLRDEARILGQLRHRAIVYVDELILIDGQWAVVMEYIGGVDLRRIVARGPVPPGPALEVVSEVAGALATAYWTRSRFGNPLRMLHRDLKPSNIIVTPHGEVKVVDFGVAYADFEEREAITGGRRFGTSGYVAPERFEGKDGPEGDVYSLGAVFYELLSGRPLGRGPRGAEGHDRHTQRGMQALRGFLPDAPMGVFGLLRSSLDHDPRRRPSARDIERRAKDLRAELASSWLREWAEAHIPPLMAEANHPDERATEDETDPFLSMSEEGASGTLVEPTDETPSDPTFWTSDSSPTPNTAPAVPSGIRSLKPSATRIHASLGVDTDSNIREDTRPTIRTTSNPLAERPLMVAAVISACAFALMLAWLLLYG